MRATSIIERMATHPNAELWYRRRMQRVELASIQPEDNPLVMTSRPYGQARGIGGSTPPVDPQMGRFGGTMRGRRLGDQWGSLQIQPQWADAAKAPQLITWSPSTTLRTHGSMWHPSMHTWNAEEPESV